MCMESMDSVERQFEARDLALARLEGEREKGGELVDRSEKSHFPLLLTFRWLGYGSALVRLRP